MSTVLTIPGAGRRPSGRSSRPPETTAGRFTRWGVIALAVAGFAYLLLPIALIVAFSFNDPVGRFNIVWHQFTFDNWRNPLQPGPLTDAMVLSLKVASLSAAAATVFGTLLALALERYRFRGAALVGVLLVLPLTTPELVLGTSLATLFIDAGVARGFWTIVIGHIMFSTAFVALVVRARISGFDWTLEDAAMDLGARPWRTFSRVTLPLIAPGILAGALLAFALSIDDFIITFFNAGAEETFPLRVWGASKVEIPPQIHVLTTIVLMVSLTLLLAGSFVRRRVEGGGDPRAPQL